MKTYIKTNKYNWIPPIIGSLVLALVWGILAFVVNDPSVFPGPIASIESAFGLLSKGYWRDFLASSFRALVGWFCALALGIPFGLILGMTPRFHSGLHGTLAFLRSLPAFILIMVPAAFGKGGDLVRLGVITFACALIIIDECSESLRTLPPERIDTIRAYRGRWWFILTRILFYESLGRSIVPVARTTMSIAFIVTIVCEMLLPPIHGIGARLLISLTGMELPEVFGFILLTGTAGFTLNTLIHLIAQRLIFWR